MQPEKAGVYLRSSHCLVGNPVKLSKKLEFEITFKG